MKNNKIFKILQNNIYQIWIILFSCPAILLLNYQNEYSKWGCILGLISQPAWLITSYKNQQIGVGLMSCWYTLAWIQGILTHWEFY